MIEQQGLLQTLVTGIVELLPDTSLWRLTLTGDMAASVNRVTERADDNPYTTDRGAGQAGAITLPHDDGTFDIVVSANVLFATREDLESVEALIAHVIAAAEHLGRHEAGHAALRLRGGDADAYQDERLRNPASASALRWWETVGWDSPIGSIRSHMHAS